jgi:hypothetical protein
MCRYWTADLDPFQTSPKLLCCLIHRYLCARLWTWYLESRPELGLWKLGEIFESSDEVSCTPSLVSNKINLSPEVVDCTVVLSTV